MAPPRKRKALDFVVEGARNLLSAVSVSISPGLNFVEGFNGAGKTTIIESILAWGGRKVGLPVNAGASKIRIHGPQAIVEIGRTRKEDGSPSVELVADDAFATLIDPAIKEPKARAKARVEAFLRFRPIPITSDLLLRLCGGDETIAAAVQGKRSADWESMTLDDAAEEARVAANGLAHPLESQATSKRGAGDALLRQAEDLAEDIAEVPEEAVEDLARQVDQVSRSSGEMRLRAEGRRDLEKQQEDLRGSLGARPDLKELELGVAMAEGDVAELTEKLRAAEGRRGEAAAALKAGEARDRDWQRNHAILSKEVTGPTPADVERTEDALKGLREKHAAAEKEARRVALMAQATAELNASRESEGKAAKYRAIAQTAKADVAKILAEQGLEGVSFVSGDLAVEVDGEIRPVDALSFGERVTFALRVVLPAYKEADLPPVFWLREAFWYALQPQKQDALERLGKEEGIYFLIERPTEGALQVANRPAKDVRPAVEAS